MESERSPTADSVGVPARKSRKDSSKRSHDKASSKDARSHSILDDLLRTTRSKSTASVSTSNPSVASSKFKPVLSSASQSSLADFTQTAATVSRLSDLSKPRNNEKISDTGPTDSVEIPKGKRVDLNSFRFGHSQQMTRPVVSQSYTVASNSSKTAFPTTFPNGSPLRKAPLSASGSPSPPTMRRAGTPVRDEPREDEILASQHEHLLRQETLDHHRQREHLLRQEAQDHLRHPGVHDNFLQYGDQDGGALLGQNQFVEVPRDQRVFRDGFFPGIPQGSNLTPKSMVMDYPGGVFNPRFPGHPPNNQAGPDLMSVFTDGFTRVLNRIGDLKSAGENSSRGKSSADNMVSRDKSSTDTMDMVEVKQEEVSEESDEEESFVSWSGQKLINRTPSVILSEEGSEAWKALKGLDDNGIESGNFRKVARKDKDISFYSKGGKAFTPQEKNLELPKLSGYKDRDEKKLVQKDKALGAIGAALVAAVDAARESADDLASARQDLERDVYEDVTNFAIETCASSNLIINERVISHLIKALKMTAVESALITMERRALAESEVPHEDMRKILSDSPPDDTFLYGGAVRDSVQKARDASLLSKAFNNRYGGGKEKAFARKSVYRPRDMRFKGGSRRFSKGNKAEPYKNGKFGKGLKKDRFKKD